LSYFLRNILPLSLCIFSGHTAAETFDFSYAFGDLHTISGSLDGSRTGQFINGISNVSVFYDGVVMNGSPNMFVLGYSDATNFDIAIPAVVSFDGALNNFMFIDSNDASGRSLFTNIFYMLDTPTLSLAEAAGDAFFSNDRVFNPLTNAPQWTLTRAIPEPETYTLLLASCLGLIGFTARRSKRKAV
jgi:hypothetical protein